MSLSRPNSLASYNEKTFAGLPGGQPLKKAAEAAVGPGLREILGLWAFFVLNRAAHPLVIDLSKDGDGKLPYSKLTPVIAKSFLTVAACNLLASCDRDGWRVGIGKCWSGASLSVFSKLGMSFAFGDFLEMVSMSSMDGAAYQVLLQSKLVITALMMWYIKGTSARQTPTQWSVLVTVSLGMCLFMLTQEAGSGKARGSGSASLLGTAAVLSKVGVSCYSAVHADQSLKRFKNLPWYVQLSQLTASWGLFSLLLAALLQPGVVLSPQAFFHGWNYATVLVCLSFAFKTFLTMTLLKVLDSVLKNIGEAVAVLVIYLAQVLLPSMPTQFEVTTFLALLVVVMTVTTYMLLKGDLAKASQAASASDDGPDAKSKVQPDRSLR